MRPTFRREQLGRAVLGFLAAMLVVAVAGAVVGLDVRERLAFGVALGVGFALGALFFDRS